MSNARHFKFRSRPEAVAAARRALDGYEHLLDLSAFYDASLCVSELVTNAVLHADVGETGELELIVSIVDDALRVAVIDPGTGFEGAVPPPGDESGWGLYIVDRLSDRWGVEHGERTRVWFEIGVRTRASDEPASEPARGRRPAPKPPAKAPASGRKLGPRRRSLSKLRLKPQSTT